MTQSRTQSITEVVTGTACGYLIALATQEVVFPLFDLPCDIRQNMQIALIFTVVSIIRSYIFRRLFNRIAGRR